MKPSFVLNLSTPPYDPPSQAFPTNYPAIKQSHFARVMLLADSRHSLIPGGFIHAVHTPEFSVGFTGNFLSSTTTTCRCASYRFPGSLKELLINRVEDFCFRKEVGLHEVGTDESDSNYHRLVRPARSSATPVRNLFAT